MSRQSNITFLLLTGWEYDDFIYLSDEEISLHVSGAERFFNKDGTKTDYFYEYYKSDYED